MLAALATLTLLQSAAVSLELPCTTSGEAIPRIAAQANLKLAVSAECKGDPLILRVAQAPGEELLAKIAQVTGAQWVTDSDGTRRLSRPPVLERAQYKTFREERAKSLSAGYKAVVDASLKPYDADAAIARVMQKQPVDDEPDVVAEFAPGADGPTSRIIGRLLRHMSLEALSSIEPGQKLVFSTHPTKMQIGLGKDALQEVVWLNKTHDDFLAALRKKPKAASRFSYSDGHEWKYPADRLILTAVYGYGSIQLVLTGKSKGGQSILQASRSVPFQFTPRPIPDSLPKTAPELPDLEKRLQRAAQATYTYGSTQEKQPLTNEIRQAIVNAKAHDSTSSVYAAILMGAAAKEGLNLVAVPPSESFFRTLQYDPKKPLKEFWGIAGGVIALENGWLTVTPFDHFEHRMRRYNRDLLAQAFASISRQQAIALGDQAALALSTEWPNEVGGAIHLAKMLAPGSGAMLRSETERQFLRFLGSLPPEWIDTMLERDVTTSQLPPRSKELLTKLVFGVNSYVMRQTGRAREMLEPTEVLVNGLPLFAKLRLRRQERQAAFDASQEHAFSTEMPFDANNVAYQVARKELGLLGKNERIFESYQIGKQIAWTLSIEFGQDLSSTYSISETRVDRNAKPLLPAEFSGAFGEEFRKHLETHKGELKNPRPPVRIPPPLGAAS